MADFSPLFSQCLIASAFIKPETRVIDTSEVYKVVNEAAPYGFLNGIYRTHFSPEQADTLVREHHEFYRRRGVSFRWYTFANSNPADLEGRLRQMKPSGVTDLEGLVLDVAEASLEMPEGVTVEEAGMQNVEDYAAAVVAGWEQMGKEAESVRQDIRRDIADPKRTWVGFLARYKGEPACTGMIRIVGEAGYLQGGSTNPKYRGKGVYKGLVAGRMAYLNERNIEHALILARSLSSAPICRKLGFKQVCLCRSFDFNF